MIRGDGLASHGRVGARYGAEQSSTKSHLSRASILIPDDSSRPSPYRGHSSAPMTLESACSWPTWRRASNIPLLVLWTSGVPRTKATIATTALTLAGYLVFAVLSHLEHIHSFRPSTLLDSYLGVTLLLDLARVRTLWFIPGNHNAAAISTAAFAIKLIIFLLELVEKRSLVRQEYSNITGETASGIFNRVLFLWINPLLLRGSKSLLGVRTLPNIDEDLIAASDVGLLTTEWRDASSPGEIHCYSQWFNTSSGMSWLQHRHESPGSPSNLRSPF
ncbi:hypothetical protein MRB53_037827 [Persea americana]|nr:hypothetical protein MRB53_037827 [Persea americana]